MQRLSKKHAILILVVGVLFFAVAVFAWIKTVHYRGEGIRVDAVITDIETTYFDDDTDHTVTVRFVTEDGEEITGELDAYQSGFYVGKTVPVLYLPDDPHKFTYAKNGLLLPLIFIGAGVFLLGFGVFALVRKDRGYDDGTDYTPDDASGA